MLAALNHPNVLRFYGVVTASASEQTVVGIMTEYMPGGSLSNYLRCGPPPPRHQPSCVSRMPPAFTCTTCLLMGYNARTDIVWTSISFLNSMYHSSSHLGPYGGRDCKQRS